MSDEIVISEYNTGWPSAFLKEALRLTEVLNLSVVTDLQHFGSTSIPGLAAKPVIDIMIGFRSMEDAYRSLPAFTPLGYHYLEELSVPGGRLFLKRQPRTHHLHLAEYGTEHWWKPLLFRDYLRVHAEERQAYEALKRGNAAKFRYERHLYTEAKTAYVRDVLEKAAYHAGSISR
ncbi:GrpB family protein [Gorillibacterium sp. sgz5001074]|uniref:GrpB family protein n=1 Tax=Gorillibacterium sp. sgz5001074 TaxID=3446695 RepID=UPI003F67709E